MKKFSEMRNMTRPAERPQKVRAGLFAIQSLHPPDQKFTPLKRIRFFPARMRLRPEPEALGNAVRKGLECSESLCIVCTFQNGLSADAPAKI